MITMNGRPSLASAGLFELTSAARELTPSATLAINETVAQKQANGEELLHLGFGQSSFPMHPLLLDAFARAASETGYAPVMGLPSLRAAIASYLHRSRRLKYTAQDVIIGPGSKALLYALLQLLEGDLILPRPSWVSYLPQARLAGKQVVWVETSADDRHRITPEALNEAMERGCLRKANPRILLINSPSNPTGGMFDEFEVRAIAQWARDNQVTVISDEIYAEVVHGLKEHVSVARFYPEATIVTGGMSKAFSAGGWRIGYAALPNNEFGRRLRNAMQGMASEIWSAATTPAQEAAVVAYSDDRSISSYVSNCATLHGHVAQELHNALTDMGMVCQRPAGAFYLYPDFLAWRDNLERQGVRTSPQLAQYLIEKWNIAVLPGTEFGDLQENLTVRISTSMLFDHLRPNADNSQRAELRKVLFSAVRLADDDALASRSFSRLSFDLLDEAIARFQQLIFTLS